MSRAFGEADSLGGGFAPSSSGSDPASGRAKHVLVVDDYADLAELMGELLIDACPTLVTVDIAHDGAEAVERALSTHPDVAILDINMPVMDGIQAALAIRKELGPNAPLLIGMTGNLANVGSTRAQQAFDRMLRKPVDMSELVTLVCAA